MSLLLLFRPNIDDEVGRRRPPPIIKPATEEVVKALPISLTLKPVDLDIFYRKVYLDQETLTLLYANTTVTQNARTELFGTSVRSKCQNLDILATMRAGVKLSPLTRELTTNATSQEVYFNRRFDEELAIALIVALRKRKNGHT